MWLLTTRSEVQALLLASFFLFSLLLAAQSFSFSGPSFFLHLFALLFQSVPKTGPSHLPDRYHIRPVQTDACFLCCAWFCPCPSCQLPGCFLALKKIARLLISVLARIYITANLSLLKPRRGPASEMGHVSRKTTAVGLRSDGQE